MNLIYTDIAREITRSVITNLIENHSPFTLEGPQISASCASTGGEEVSMLEFVDTFMDRVEPFSIVMGGLTMQIKPQDSALFEEDNGCCTTCVCGG
jgi:hypothetical protein